MPYLDQPVLNIDQLIALSRRHPFTAQIIQEVFDLVAPTHTNAVAAVDQVLTKAMEEGRDPLKVAAQKATLNSPGGDAFPPSAPA